MGVLFVADVEAIRAKCMIRAALRKKRIGRINYYRLIGSFVANTHQEN
jgi:hypothetical protein